MHAFTIMTGLVAAASAAAIERSAAVTGPQGKGLFQLQVIATDGNLKYSGMFLNTYHVGAGSSALVTSDAQQGAQQYKFNSATGQLSAHLGDYDFFLENSAGSVFPAPAGYSYTGLQAGGSDYHYSFSGPGNYLQFGPNFKGDNFAICAFPIYNKEDHIPTLVFRKSGAKKNPACADVKVKAIF